MRKTMEVIVQCRRRERSQNQPAVALDQLEEGKRGIGRCQPQDRSSRILHSKEQGCYQRRSGNIEEQNASSLLYCRWANM
jgi:hypothetical protein